MAPGKERPQKPICQRVRLHETSGVQRLGKNNGAYHGEQIDVRSVLRDLTAAASKHGWSREVFHEQAGLEWLGLHRPARSSSTHQAAPRFYLSAGIHGDEPAGPLAILQLLREDRLPANAELFIAPCLNPAGFLTNQRENPQGLDLNRDYLHLQSDEIRTHVAWLERQPAFDLCLCLHEDWEAEGFYLYELNPENQPSLADRIIQNVQATCPVDRSVVIDGRSASGGIIRPALDPKLRRQWPEAFWLLTHKTRLSYTLEAPSDFPLATRVAALVSGVQAALDRSPVPTPAPGSQ